MSGAEEVFPQGRLSVGCNYWASHAGTAMWSDWQPEVVKADLQQLAAEGMQVLRVFPLWPDFQPLTQLYTGGGREEEVRHGETPLAPAGPRDVLAVSGICPQALERFAFLADTAAECGLGLLVGLITGWMSGRLFVPPALAHRNVLSDPVAIQWQVRFIRGFVGRFRAHPAVVAWDLGNECNCMAPLSSSQAAYGWTAVISQTIRACDPVRPIVSGMHSIEPQRNAVWRIQDQAELTDILTTHPYPVFTPHCFQDPVNELRNGLHATAQTRWYEEIGGVAAIAEEMGTLGPMVCSDAVSAAYTRSSLYSLWAHDCKAMLWWCAYDQDHLTHAPYDWTAYERELGLIRNNREVKPVMKTIAQVQRTVAALPFAALPPRRTEALCLLTDWQDTWGAAYSSFILAKQAGFDLRFRFIDQTLPEADLYILPSLSGDRSLPLRTWRELLARVEAGATLYLSLDDCTLHPFCKPLGMDVVTCSLRTEPVGLSFGGESLTCAARRRFNLEPRGAQVLAREGDGNPAYTCTAYGKGRIYCLTVPLETSLANTPGAFHGGTALPGWRFYADFAAAQIARRIVRKDNIFVGLTEHPCGDAGAVVVAINYASGPQEVALTLAQGWRIEKALVGGAPQGDGRLIIPANDACVLQLVRG